MRVEVVTVSDKLRAMGEALQATRRGDSCTLSYGISQTFQSVLDPQSAMEGEEVGSLFSFVVVYAGEDEGAEATRQGDDSCISYWWHMLQQHVLQAVGEARAPQRQ